MLSQADIEQALRAVGVQAGDLVMLHADALVLAQLPPMALTARYQCLFDAFANVLGSQGTLVMPTFTYSLTKQERFDPMSTPSAVGALSDHFRQLPDVLRSADPLFSIAARGARAAELVAADGEQSFGDGSPFALLAAHNAWLLCLGCSLDRITFTHYVEQQIGVDYRYLKTFSGERIVDGEPRPVQRHYYVRDLDRATGIHLARLQGALQSTGQLHTAAVGRVALYAVRCADFAAIARALVAVQPNALIQEGAA